MHNKFKGLYAANIIPLNKDRSINYTEFKNHIKDLLNQGINNFLINGHAGENFTLAMEEQVRILQTIRGSVKKKI